MFPELKNREAILIMGECKFYFKCKIDENCWDTNISGKTLEIIEESENGYILTSKQSYEQFHVLKEWTKNRRKKTVSSGINSDSQNKELQKLKSLITDMLKDKEKEK